MHYRLTLSNVGQSPDLLRQAQALQGEAVELLEGAERRSYDLDPRRLAEGGQARLVELIRAGGRGGRPRPALPEGGCREGGDQPPNPRPRLLARDRLPDAIAVARCAQRPPRDLGLVLPCELGVDQRVQVHVGLLWE